MAADMGQGLMAQDLAGRIASMAAQGVAVGVNQWFKRFASAYTQEATNGTDLLHAYERMARAGQRASVDRYLARRSDAPEYRVGQGRISGGALRRVLQSPDFATADKTGIKFGNTTRLYKEAKHWARINDSAGPQASHPSVSFRFDDRQVYRYQSRRTLRPLWQIPVPNYWKGGEFHIGRGGVAGFRTIKSAHQPFHFIEAGVQAMADLFPSEMAEVMTEWERKAKTKAGGRSEAKLRG